MGLGQVSSEIRSHIADDCVKISIFSHKLFMKFFITGIYLIKLNFRNGLHLCFSGITSKMSMPTTNRFGLVLWATSHQLPGEQPKSRIFFPNM